MDNKQLYHIAGEVVVIAGLSMYFMKQLKIQKDELKELRDEVKKHQDQTNKNLEMIYKILDKAFGINTQPILNQTSNENKDQSTTESKNKEDPRSSKENFKNSSPQIIQQEQAFAVPMMSMLAMTNPLGFGIVQETQLRHRNRPPQTEIQIVDEQPAKMNGQGFSNKTSLQIQDNFDSDNDDEIMEELIELERDDEDENEDENVHQETMNDNQTLINNDQSEQYNKTQEQETLRQEPEPWKPEEVQEKPFYPEPSKKKKISKKQT